MEINLILQIFVEFLNPIEAFLLVVDLVRKMLEVLQLHLQFIATLLTISLALRAHHEFAGVIGIGRLLLVAIIVLNEDHYILLHIRPTSNARIF